MTTWMHDAACRDRDPEDWFPSEGGHLLTQANMKAKAVCADCPVRIACLRYALDEDISHGIFGGMTPAERVRWRKRPKVAKKENKWTVTQQGNEATASTWIQALDFAWRVAL